MNRARPKRKVAIELSAGAHRKPIIIPKMHNIAILDLSKILLISKLLLLIEISDDGIQV